MCNLFCKLFIGYRSKPEQTTNGQLSVTTYSLTHLLPIPLTSLCTLHPGSFVLLQTHRYFISPMSEQKTFGQRCFSYCAPKQWNSLPCLQNGVKNSPLQTIPQVISNSVFLLASPTYPPSPLVTFLLLSHPPPPLCVCVCVCVRARARVCVCVK